MDIVVLAGGLSTERDVSLITGKTVTKALREMGHRVIMLDVFLGYENDDADISDIFAAGIPDPENTGIPGQAPDIDAVKALRSDKSVGFFGPNVIRICQAADIVFMALHGENGENGKVQAALDLFGIRYTGSGYLSSAMAMDKGITKTLFESADIPTPNGIVLRKEEACSLEDTGLTLPLVVKPCCGGSSIGVSIVRTGEEYAAAMREAFKYEDEVIIEKYVKGREFSVGVIDMKALPVIEIAPVEGFYDYQNKYKAGSTVETCPADLPEDTARRMQEIAVRVCEVLCLDTYSRMDFLMDTGGELYCLEANTLPGMTPTSLLPQEAAVLGMNFNALCEELIRVSLKKYGRYA
ncbi:MAG: D-alanine--D-alanine ligase [Clostridiales bacterium]|nr:D-alanine--D-alanine ligase [Clostridiales bacterium]